MTRSAAAIGLLAVCGTAALLAGRDAAAWREESREDRPTYTVARTTAPLRIDGRPDEAAWRRAESFAFVSSHDGSPAPAIYATTAKALYDDRFVYFAFENADPNAWATRGERDQHLWEEEVVEVFIQADPSHPSYIELEVNPLGAMLDIFLIDVREPIPYASWNSAGLRWAVSVDGTVDGEPGDTGWSAEIALPVEDVVTAPNRPPKPGDRWRANLYRVERRPERAGLAWSPTLVRDFHRPERFGELVFSDRTLP